MSSPMQHGYLVLADISGYTRFLAGSELDHAHQILTDLLETIVTRLKDGLIIAKLEGDAVFAYAPEQRMPRGETVVELVEATYSAFRDRVETMRRHTTCTCRACQAMPTLDLKFVTHHGSFMEQQVSGTRELIGSDVNLVHRLLKNRVSEATGWRAYSLFTEEGIGHLSVRPENLHEQVEMIEHLGEVKTYSQNLLERYEELRAARRVYVSAEEADQTLVVEIPAPPIEVWQWLNDPKMRSMWAEGTRWSAFSRPSGRTGPGATNHCAHGKSSVSVEEIVDWRPFDYFTSMTYITPGSKMRYLATFELEPVAGGRETRLHFRCRIDINGMPRWVARQMAKRMIMPTMAQNFEGLRRIVTQPAAGSLAYAGVGP